MPIPKTFVAMMQHALHGPRYEPKKRVKSLEHVPRGERHLPERPRYVPHRFAIRGGISWMTVLAKNVYSDNTLLSRLTAKA